MTHPFLLVYMGLVGLCFGSFANVVIHRLPIGESIVTPPSHCIYCKKRLKPKHLIPIISWLFLNGKCAYCHVPINVRYPIVEALCAWLFILMTIHSNNVVQLAALCAFSFVLLCVSFVDIYIQEIPDSLLIFGAIVGVMWVGASHFAPLSAPTVQDALAGAIAGAAPLYMIDFLTKHIIKKDGFGFGDIKLMAMAGLFIGWQEALLSLIIAVLSAGLFGTALIALNKATKGAYMPFGPFLAVGIVVSLWFGQAIINTLFW